jgi:hypothetical protein
LNLGQDTGYPDCGVSWFSSAPPGKFRDSNSPRSRPLLFHQFTTFVYLGWGETDWVHFVRWPLFSLLYQPRMIDDDEYGVVRGTKIGRGDRSTQRKPVSLSVCPPQIPHDLTWDRTRAAAVGSRRLTLWVISRSNSSFTIHPIIDVV